MFDARVMGSPGLGDVVDHLAALDGADLTDAECIDHVALLERVKSAASAAQARISVAFDASQREQAARRGVAAARRGQGVAEQLALARRESPHRCSVHLGLARALVGEMPHTLPSWLGRRVVADAHRAWVRRLFTAPTRADLVSTDRRRREFTGPLRQLLVVRDRICRTPYCGAAIKHADHADPHAAGGQTSLDNGQGLCERCNYVKQAAGWRAIGTSTSDGGRHRVTLTTPTGHTDVSHARRPPGAGPPGVGIDLYVGPPVAYAA